MLKDYKKTALVFKSQIITYFELLQYVNFISATYFNKNIKKAAIFSENRPEWIYSLYAAFDNNCVTVTIDFMSNEKEVSYILNDSKPEIVFCSQKTKEIMDKTIELLDYKVKIVVFEDIEYKLKKSAKETNTPKEDDVSVIIYTSGTTGNPKGVMLTYGNLLFNINAVSKECEVYNSNDNVFALLPFHHIFPLLGTILIPLSLGAKITFSPSLLPADIVSTMEKEKVSIIIGVPRFYNLIKKGIEDKIKSSKIASNLFKLAKKVNSVKFSKKIFKKVHTKFGGNIKYMVTGGAKIEDETWSLFKTLGFQMIEGYGMTETSPMISFTKPDNIKIGAAGQLLQGVDVKIVDGEITVKGPNIMKGYYNREKETNDIIKDGYLHTGDLGYLDKEGFLYITGRKKEIIVLSNGKNINPSEVETVIMNITDTINEIGVFERNDTLFAIIFPNLKKINGDAQQHFKDVIDKYNKYASHYKKINGFTIVKEELPKTKLGKLKRFELQNLLTTESKKEVVQSEDEEFKIIKEYIKTQSDKEADINSHLEIDLGLDSLDKISLLSFINGTFGTNLEEKDFSEYMNMNKLVDYIKSVKTKMNIETINWKEIISQKVDLTLPKSTWIHMVMKNGSYLFFKTIFDLEVTGKENLTERPFILASNHQSAIDGLLIACLLNNKTIKNTYFFAKDKHFQHKKWRMFMAKRNNIILMNKEENVKESIQKMATVLKDDKNIIIFPEGTRSTDGKLKDFKKTFAIISKELNIPIIPVVISGADKAQPINTKKLKFFSKIKISFLPAVYPQEDDTYDTLKEKVKSLIEFHKEKEE